MDYLKEGINLRAMGNQDPLVAWQREGFAMFGKLMDNINDDYLRYVFHVQVLTEEPAAEPDLAQASYVAADDPVQGDAAVNAAFANATPAELEAAAAVAGGVGGPGALPYDDSETQAPIVKSDREKIGRNEPCWCGSGKKYKLCHGAN
jgi:preprotein translocase subunit SecA